MAFCPKCGSALSEGTVFCPQCGASIASQTTNYGPTYNPTPASIAQPAHSMGWFKFLINFALWAGAILNIISAFPVLTGSQYGSAADIELIYGMYEGLQTLDMISGLLALALGVFGIYTRFQLAGYKANGPQLLTILYIGAIISNIIYIVGYNSLLPDLVLQNINFSSYYSSCVVSVVMIFVNRAYFNNRADLFIN